LAASTGFSLHNRNLRCKVASNKKDAEANAAAPIRAGLCLGKGVERRNTMLGMQEPMAHNAAFRKIDKSRHLAIVLITRSLDVNGAGRAMLLSQLPVLIAGALIFAICWVLSAIELTVWQTGLAVALIAVIYAAAFFVYLRLNV
jgi:hypothetical protein